MSRESRRSMFQGGAWLMVLATPIYVFLILPSLIVVPMSFDAGGGFSFPPRAIGLDLYRQLMDPTEGWLGAIGRSFAIALLTMCLATTLGVPAAYALARYDERLVRYAGALLLSPIVIPHIVIALALYLFYGSLQISSSLFGVVIGHAVVTMPFVIITALSGLNALDRNIELAASVVGASPVQVIVYVVLPALYPAVLTGLLFSFLLSFDEVVISWFIGNSVHPTLPVKMYSSIQWEISPVLAAVSTLLVLLSGLICFMGSWGPGQERPVEQRASNPEDDV